MTFQRQLTVATTTYYYLIPRFKIALSFSPFARSPKNEASQRRSHTATRSGRRKKVAIASSVATSDGTASSISSYRRDTLACRRCFFFFLPPPLLLLLESLVADLRRLRSLATFLRTLALATFLRTLALATFLRTLQRLRRFLLRPLVVVSCCGHLSKHRNTFPLKYV